MCRVKEGSRIRSGVFKLVGHGWLWVSDLQVRRKKMVGVWCRIGGLEKASRLGGEDCCVWLDDDAGFRCPRSSSGWLSHVRYLGSIIAQLLLGRYSCSHVSLGYPGLTIFSSLVLWPRFAAEFVLMSRS
ncbi:hypothetical protein L6452_26641 [Arctium lappa]|uniref:Uncharacterized protein n=1 Tax=Arctium lappa TaxID=4217 RepID=A0ACB8ZWE0_ARCLA|nr:hypothetical protein L6452_26641 [Arctium lappa]